MEQAYAHGVDKTSVEVQDAILQAVSGLGGDLLSKLLPLLAPIVMSYLARKLGMGGSPEQQGGSGNVLGDLLGGLLGGAGGSAAGGGLGDLLGQGDQRDQRGQQPQGSGDILGGLLGQILGR